MHVYYFTGMYRFLVFCRCFFLQPSVVCLFAIVYAGLRRACRSTSSFSSSSPLSSSRSALGTRGYSALISSSIHGLLAARRRHGVFDLRPGAATSGSHGGTSLEFAACTVAANPYYGCYRGICTQPGLAPPGLEATGPPGVVIRGGLVVP